MLWFFNSEAMKFQIKGIEETKKQKFGKEKMVRSTGVPEDL